MCSFGCLKNMLPEERNNGISKKEKIMFFIEQNVFKYKIHSATLQTYQTNLDEKRDPCDMTEVPVEPQPMFLCFSGDKCNTYNKQSQYFHPACMLSRISHLCNPLRMFHQAQSVEASTLQLCNKQEVPGMLSQVCFLGLFFFQ